MHHHYQDIRDRIPEDPKWWDEHAVPRYCEFGPGETADIYASEVALVLIRCQSCDRPFHVCFSWGSMKLGQNEDGTWYGKTTTPQTVESVEQLHYGDPPNAWCCAAGATMNSTPVKVLEFWRRNRVDWERVPELEIAIECEWAC